MTGFMRKASLKMRESARDLADIAEGRSGKDKNNDGERERLGMDPGRKEDKVSKPPKSRSASTANSISLDDDGTAFVEPRKRRESITKRGKKRLSTLFSSSSLASHDDRQNRERSSSPIVHSSPLNRSVDSSGATTPTRDSSSVATTLINRNAHAPSLAGKGQPPHPEDLRQRVEDISLTGTSNSSDVQGLNSSTTVSGAPATVPAVNGSPGRQRAESLFSQWDLDELSDDDDDDAGFFTPTEGLSDIGEGDEEEEPGTGGRAAGKGGATGSKVGSRTIVPGQPISTSPTSTSTSPTHPAAQVAAPGQATAPIPAADAGAVAAADAPTQDLSTAEINPALDATNVSKGATASTSNILGTGPSTIRRSKPIQSTTRVKPRSTTKSGALSFDQEKALGPDVDTTREVLRRFLTSQMKEAEDLCYEADPEGNHLYLQSAHGYIQALKGMMTFDANDLANALEICRNIHVTATALRKPGDGLMSRVGGLVSRGAGVARVKQMSLIEKHAELVYAESSLMKAMLGIIAGGDWMGLIKEALNMRSAHGIYHTLQQFIDQSDKDGYDEEIDMDFRSGVALGTGTSSLMLSLLPGKVLKIAEVFGYAGDRTAALNTLMSSGGWSAGSETPAHDERDEGLRRPVCDLILLAFHLVISLLMPVAGVDIGMARKILEYNNRRYPDGIFFLYFTARLHTAQCEPEKAITCLQRALDLQLEYVQLQHMCLWDYALDYMMINNWKGALDCFSILREESNWSRAVYTYSTAASLVELVADDHPGASLVEADKLMKTVKSLTKKMAGKSLPIEKLCVRKTRKFETQGQYLFLPGMELAYVFGSLFHCPRKTLLGTHIPRIERQMAKLEAKGEEAYGSGYWDDYCLGQFLRGTCLAVARYQPPDAVPEARVASPGEPSDDEIDRMAEEAMLDVVENGPKVQLDHYILYHNHFELGKLYARRGDTVKAQKQFDYVMNGKLAHPNQYEAKSQGKYSLEGALLLKTHSAIQALKEGRTPA